MPATIATGVAITIAPGQPITSSVSASSTSPVSAPASAARTMIDGVYQPAKRSIVRCTGALASWASSTRCTMRASVVSAPTPVASSINMPSRLTVPA